MKKSATRTKLYGWMLVLLSPLTNYTFFGGVLDLEVVVVVLFTIGLFLTNRVTLSSRVEILPLLFYTLAVTVLNLISGPFYSDRVMIILRAGRYLLYLVIIFLLCLDNVFDYAQTMRAYRFVAYLALIHVSAQTIAYYALGITIPGQFGREIGAVAIGEVGRFRAFYSEPSDMGYCMIPFVCASLFGKPYRARDTRLMDAIAISVAVVLTTSGQGTLCVGLLWVVWIVRNILTGRLSSGYFLVVAVIFSATAVLYSIGILDFTLSRVQAQGEYSATTARLSGYETLKLLSPRQLIFGTGYGNYVTENIYGLSVPFQFVNYSSIAEALFTTGMIGTILLMALFARGFQQGNSMQRMLIVCVLALAIGGCPLTGKFLPIYCSMIFFRDEERTARRISGRMKTVRQHQEGRL